MTSILLLFCIQNKLSVYLYRIQNKINGKQFYKKNHP